MAAGAANRQSRQVNGRFELDELDKQILRILLNDGSVPYTDIARELKVSGGTIHVRMRKMQEAGVVQGTRLLVNHSKLGYDITAFLGIYLEKGSAYRSVMQELCTIPGIVEIHYTTGVYNIFCKVVCQDTRSLREVLNEKIQPIDGVQRTETFISLDETVQREIQLPD